MTDAASRAKPSRGAAAAVTVDELAEEIFREAASASGVSLADIRASRPIVRVADLMQLDGLALVRAAHDLFHRRQPDDASAHRMARNLAVGRSKLLFVLGLENDDPDRLFGGRHRWPRMRAPDIGGFKPGRPVKWLARVLAGRLEKGGL